MAEELRSMFRPQGNEMSIEESEEKQKYEMEIQKKRDMTKKQSTNFNK